MLIIGIDNGVTGSVGVFYRASGGGENVQFSFPTPTLPRFHFGDETINKYTRFDGEKFREILASKIPPIDRMHVVIERPMLGSGPRFHSSISAAMCHADQTTYLKLYAKACGARLTISVVDSKEWQAWIRKQVPTKYRKDTKAMSTYFAKQHGGNINPDGDGFCITCWAYYKLTKENLWKLPSSPKKAKKSGQASRGNTSAHVGPVTK